MTTPTTTTGPLPNKIAWRRKAMFRAPFDSFHSDQPPAFVEQLFSPESLRKTGYFDVAAVQHWRTAFKQMRANSTQRTSVEMGLAGVLSTQLWHHQFIDASLAEVPSFWQNGSKAMSPTVLSTGSSNAASGFLSSANQQRGGAQGNGKLTNSTVIATTSNNSASGFLSSASQSVGVAK